MADMHFKPQPASREPLGEGNQGGGETILVIDDEALVRLSLRRSLCLAGYKVLEALNGEIGVEIVQREHVDLVLMDWAMPGMSGEETLATLHALHPRLPVIVWSGYSLDQKQLAGCAAILQKPVSAVTVNEAVRWVLSDYDFPVAAGRGDKAHSWRNSTNPGQGRQQGAQKKAGQHKEQGAHADQYPVSRKGHSFGGHVPLQG